MQAWRKALWASLCVVLLTAWPAGAPAGAQEGSISVDAPSTSQVGEVVEISVGSPSTTAAFETGFSYDHEALEFAGAYFDQPVEVLTVDGVDGLADVGAFRCSTDLCDDGLVAPVGAMKVRFIVLTAGTHKITLRRGLAVDAAGSVVAETASQEIVVGAGEGPETSGANDTALSSNRAAVSQEQADVTGDSRVDRLDALEAASAWDSVRRVDGPCQLDEWSAGFDIDASGCLDVADLAAISAAIGPALVVEDGVAGLWADEAPAHVAAADLPFVVNSTLDAGDRSLTDGVCQTSTGVCTLRAAIQQANYNTGPNDIHFNIAGSGVQRINLSSPLPGLYDTTGGTTIDGYTQPGTRVNTSDLVFNGLIKIEVFGRGQTVGQSGMVIYGPSNTIRGLSVYNSFFNIHLSGNGASNNTIVGNIIGTNTATTWAETTASTDQAGVEIRSGASYNQVGTVALQDRNVISGNPYSGVRINHAETVGNRIQNNLVGFNASGTTSLYSRVAGIDAQWGAQETLIGGYQEHAGNKVAGNSAYGIDLSHSSKNNVVVGNRLGTDPSGTRTYTHTANLIGLAIKDNTVGNTIEHNVTGGNRWHGVWHRHNFTGANTFRYNWVGIGLDGSNIGNLLDGIDITGHDDTYLGNVIAYNRANGVNITDFNGGNGFSPPEYTESNRLSDNSFFGNTNAAIIITGGVQNNVAAPSITSATQGVASGTSCANCTVELYVAQDGEGRQFIASTTANGSGSWSISDPAIRNVDLVALNTTPNNDTSAFSEPRLVGTIGGNSQPNLSPMADQASGDGQWVSFSPTASDPDGDYLTFNAIGLPKDVTINRKTGEISGRPAETGTYLVSLAVDDGNIFKVTRFHWTVGGGASPSVLSGTVTYSDGDNASGIGIDLFTDGRVNYLRSLTTDNAGNYQFEVGPGCYVLTFVAPTGASFDSGQYKNASVCVDAGQTTDIDQLLIRDGAATSSIGGTVVNEGNAAQSGVSADLFNADTNGNRQSYLRSTSTSSNGTYAFELSAGGCYTIVLVAPNGSQFRNGTSYAQRYLCVAQGESNLTQNATIAGGADQASQGTIQGVVRTAAGGTPPATNIDLYSTNADGSRATWLTFDTTDTAGNYSFTRDPGCYVLIFIAPDGSNWPNGSKYREAAQCVSGGESVVVNASLG